MFQKFKEWNEDNLEYLSQGRTSTARLSYPSATEWKWDRLKLESGWSSTHTNMRWILNNLRFSQLRMCSLLFSEVRSNIPTISDKSVARKCRQNIMYWRSVTFKTNGIFLYLFECIECWCSVNCTVLVCWYNCYYYSAVTVKVVNVGVQ